MKLKEALESGQEYLSTLRLARQESMMLPTFYTGIWDLVEKGIQKHSAIAYIFRFSDSAGPFVSSWVNVLTKKLLTDLGWSSKSIQKTMKDWMNAQKRRFNTPIGANPMTMPFCKWKVEQEGSSIKFYSSLREFKLNLKPFLSEKDGYYEMNPDQFKNGFWDIWKGKGVPQEVRIIRDVCVYNDVRKLEVGFLAETELFF